MRSASHVETGSIWIDAIFNQNISGAMAEKQETPTKRKEVIRRKK